VYSIKISDSIFLSDLCIIIVIVNLLSFVKSTLLTCRFCITIKLIWNNKLKKQTREDVTNLFNVVRIFDFKRFCDRQVAYTGCV
jgi:hypothetical protein